MFRWLVGAVAWLLSFVFRVGFVLAVVGLAAGVALTGTVPTTPGGLHDVVGSVGNATGVGSLDDTSFDALERTAERETGAQAGATNASPVPSSNAGDLNGTRIEYLVHRGINERRAAHNESSLRFDTGLRSVARYHSADMANRSYFAHTAPGGQTVTDRYEKFGYRCRVPMDGLRYATGGENILYTDYGAPVRMGNRTVEYDTQRELARGIVNGWMNSTEHRENLLKPYWNNEGIGIYVQQEDGRTRVFASQEFC